MKLYDKQYHPQDLFLNHHAILIPPHMSSASNSLDIHNGFVARIDAAVQLVRDYRRVNHHREPDPVIICSGGLQLESISLRESRLCKKIFENRFKSDHPPPMITDMQSANLDECFLNTPHVLHRHGLRHALFITSADELIRTGIRAQQLNFPGNGISSECVLLQSAIATYQDHHPFGLHDDNFTPPAYTNLGSHKSRFFHTVRLRLNSWFPKRESK